MSNQRYYQATVSVKDQNDNYLEFKFDTSPESCSSRIVKSLSKYSDINLESTKSTSGNPIAIQFEFSGSIGHRLTGLANLIKNSISSQHEVNINWFVYDVVTNKNSYEIS